MGRSAGRGGFPKLPSRRLSSGSLLPQKFPADTRFCGRGLPNLAEFGRIWPLSSILYLLKPQDWIPNTNCGYEVPEDPSVLTLLDQNIKGEQCAIDVYDKLLKKVEGKDPITYNMVLSILTDEVEHEDEEPEENETTEDVSDETLTEEDQSRVDAN